MEKFERPLKDWEQFKVADPVKSGERIKSGPNFIITKDGSFHRVYSKIESRETAISRHFYRAKGEDRLSMYENNGVIKGTSRNKRQALPLWLRKWSTQIRVFDGGAKKWKVVYTAHGTRYRQCAITWDNDTCYYFLIESPKSKEDDLVPMRVLSLRLEKK